MPPCIAKVIQTLFPGIISCLFSPGKLAACLQRLAYPDRQVMHGERLLDELHSLVQDPLVGDDVGRVTGHEEAFHQRLDRAEPLCRHAADLPGQITHPCRTW